MVCADLEVVGPDDITAIAACISTEQVRQIGSAVRQVMRGLGSSIPTVAILAGKGRFLARDALRTARLESRDLASIFGATIGQATPAAAVAYLLADRCTQTLEPR